MSAEMAFSMVALGARGTTADALDSILGARGDDLARRDSAMLARLNGRRDITLEIANALWVSPRYQLQPVYEHVASRMFSANAERVELNRQAGIDRVNHWASEKTHGRIPVILNHPLTDSSAVVVTNAVYFKGLWLDAFDSAATKPMPFRRGGGSVAMVPTMEKTGELLWARIPNAQVIRLPYRGNQSALYVILPDSNASTEMIESGLIQHSDLVADSMMDNRQVHLRLPKIHAEMELDLEPPLRAMGAAVAFDCHRADFSAMLVLLPPRRACIEKAVQKTWFELDESGTEAAAVTAVGVMTATSVRLPQPTIQFIVNRPFLFILRDKASGAPLFMGRIANPSGH